MRDAKRYISKARCDESLNKITYDIVEYDLWTNRGELYYV
jgi:hypothetical protein